MSQIFTPATPNTQHISEFQQLYEKRFGIRLPSDQARSILISLLAVTEYRQRNAKYKSKRHYQRKTQKLSTNQ